MSLLRSFQTGMSADLGAEETVGVIASGARLADEDSSHGLDLE